MERIADILRSAPKTIISPAGRRILPAQYEDAATSLALHYGKEVSLRGREIAADAAAPIIEKIAVWMTSDGSHPWLVLSGTPGTGKSTALRAIRDTLRDYGVTAKMFNSSDFPVLFLDNEELTERQILGGDWCRVLLLDDVGVEPTEIKDFGNTIQPFVKIVEERYNRFLPLVISTNLDGTAIKDRYGIRTIDRFREMCVAVKYEGKSYRI